MMSEFLTEQTRTGNRRYRVLNRLFREPVLVLQLEWRRKGKRFGSYSIRGIEFDVLVWYDATVEHLTECNKK